MAMEKLILRSVMYGVDKIPDSWFDKVPGGFYKANQKANEKAAKDQKIDGGDGGKPRRYSHHGDERRRTRRDRYEEEYRAEEKRRQERRGRSSYDGSHDEDFAREGHRGAREGGRRRRRHSVDNDRYGYDDGHSGRPTNGGRQQRPADPYFDEKRRPVTSDSARDAPPVSSKAVPATGSESTRAAAADSGAPYPQTGRSSTFPAKMPSPPMKPAQPNFSSRAQSGKSTASSYVPFSHIYGQPVPGPQPTFAPPPASATASINTGITSQPHSMPTASPQSYQPNPFAQQATMPAGLVNLAQYAGPQVFAPQPTAPTSARAFTGYEHKPPYPQTPRSSRAADRYSPSYASYDAGERDSRRTRSESRQDRQQGKAPYVDPQAPLRGQLNMPPPPSGQPPATNKDPKRDSGQEYDRPRSHRTNDRGYTSD